MKSPTFLHSIGQAVRRRPLAFALLALALVAVTAYIVKTARLPTPVSSFYEVKRGDFLVSIVEGGTIEAVNEIVIRNEVEGTARIIYIVPEGNLVKKGQLLVELDSSASQDAVNLQQINVEKAQFALIQSQQQLDIQRSVVDSEVAAATLKAEFAASDLEKYVKGEAEQLRRNAQIEITNVVETLQIAEERLQWTIALCKDGYETKANLDKDRLSVSQTKLKLEQTQKALELLELFDIPKKKRTLEAAQQEAREELDRVKLQGDRKLAQYKADVETQKKTLDLSQTKLERDKKQLLATKVFAPQDGLAVYASAGGGGHFSSESMIEEGAVVRNRQELIKLPDISEMKLKVKIHESHINQVQLGQPAYVVLDSMPDQRFRGEVNKVAPLPDTQSRWGNPDLKVYATEIVITDKLPDVKPGVSARAEVIITNLANVLSIPIQAVTTRKGKPVVFLATAPQQPVPVTVGLYNIKFIEITTGVKPGDRVLLSPPFDTKEKDLGGAIMAEGDTLPVGDTNRAVRPSTRARPDNGRGSSDASAFGAGASSERRTPAGVDVPGGDRPFGRDGAGRSDAEGGGPPGASAGGNRPSREEMLKQFDKNGDGELDEEERAAMRAQFGGGRGPGGGPRLSREEMLKQFDKNGDGELDEEERAAMRARFGGGRRSDTSTNAAPNPPTARPDADH